MGCSHYRQNFPRFPCYSSWSYWLCSSNVGVRKVDTHLLWCLFLLKLPTLFISPLKSLKLWSFNSIYLASTMCQALGFLKCIQWWGYMVSTLRALLPNVADKNWKKSEQIYEHYDVFYKKNNLKSMNGGKIQMGGRHKCYTKGVSFLFNLAYFYPLHFTL